MKRATDEYAAYRKAFGEGKDEEAGKRLRAFQQALAQARSLPIRGQHAAP